MAPFARKRRLVNFDPRSSDFTSQSFQTTLDDQIWRAEKYVNLRPKGRRIDPHNIITKSECCLKRCYYQFSISDIISVRSTIIKMLGERTTKQDIEFVLHSFVLNNLSNDNGNACTGIRICNKYCCPALASQIFCSSVVRLNAYMETDIANHNYRTPRAHQLTEKRVGQLAIATKSVLQSSQPNPSGGLFLNSGVTQRKLLENTNKRLPLSVIRQYSRFSIRKRKMDNFTRCNICSTMKSIIKNRGKESDVAKKVFQAHLLSVDRDRVCVRTVEEISKSDPELLIIGMDGMANNNCKIPILHHRPKLMCDSKRIIYSTVGIQRPSIDNSGYKTVLYTRMHPMYSQTTSYYASLLLDYISKLLVMPTRLYVVTDNFMANLSDEMLGFFAYLIETIPNLRQVTMLQYCVGHTHNSVDAFFGTLSTALKKEEVLSPDDFDNVASKLPSAEEVVNNYSIFDFTPLASSINHIKSRTSHHQYCIRKKGDQFTISIAPFVSSSVYYKIGNEEEFPLFTKDPQFGGFVPKLISPNFDDVSRSIQTLYRSGKHIFTDEKLSSYVDRLQIKPLPSFHEIMAKIKAIPSARYAIPPSQYDCQTFIELIKSRGWPISQMPKKLSF